MVARVLVRSRAPSTSSAMSSWSCDDSIARQHFPPEAQAEHHTVEYHADKQGPSRDSVGEIRRWMIGCLRGGGAERVQVRALFLQLKGFIVKVLTLRMLDAEAGRRYLLPVPAAAPPLAPTAASNAGVSPSDRARRQEASQAELFSASQPPHVRKQVEPMSSRQGASILASKPRRRGSRGSGACKGKHAVDSLLVH